MQIVIYGPGGVGGAIGGLISLNGGTVTFIARGAHKDALQKRGLTLELPDRTEQIKIATVGDPKEIEFRTDAVVILSVKSQDTDSALRSLEKVVTVNTPVVCAQNGVENERRVARRFRNTYGICVKLAATHLEPGIVQVHRAPIAGILDIGLYPQGVDSISTSLAELLRKSTFDSIAVPDIMRWKYRKIVNNVTNAVEVLCGPKGRGSALAREARQEAYKVFEANDIEVASGEEDYERRTRFFPAPEIEIAPTESGEWKGGSSWQSAIKGALELELDYLNGEIVLLGRIAGVPTPVNEKLISGAKSLVASDGPFGLETPEVLLNDHLKDY